MILQKIPLKDGRTAVVRPAEPEDAAGWVEVVRSVAAEGVYLMTDRATRSPEEVRARIRDEDGTSALWLVGELDGEIIAVADFLRGRQAKNEHTASLGISIRHDCRGLGLGEPMMRAGIDWARRVGVSKLKLGVFASNRRAIALYRKLGFVEEGRLKSEVILRGEPDDEILMALWL